MIMAIVLAIVGQLVSTRISRGDRNKKGPRNGGFQPRLEGFYSAPTSVSNRAIIDDGNEPMNSCSNISKCHYTDLLSLKAQYVCLPFNALAATSRAISHVSYCITGIFSKSNEFCILLVNMCILMKFNGNYL